MIDILCRSLLNSISKVFYFTYLSLSSVNLYGGLGTILSLLLYNKSINNTVCMVQYYIKRLINTLEQHCLNCFQTHLCATF